MPGGAKVCLSPRRVAQTKLLAFAINSFYCGVPD
jgi:hypothetical protein